MKEDLEYQLMVDPSAEEESKPSVSSSSQPKDTGGLVYKIMFLQGVGLLFPWNAFINASEYYEMRFCGQWFQVGFENYFTFAFTLAQTVGLAWTIKYQNKMSWFSKIVFPLVLQMFIFLIATVLTNFYVNPRFLFSMTMLQTFVCGAVGALLSSGLYGVAGTLPSQYTGAVMNGSGLAGLSVSVSSILTTLATPPKDICANDYDDKVPQECAKFGVDYGALAYFLVAVVLLSVCVVAYYALTRLELTRYFTFKNVGTEDDSRALLIDNPHSSNKGAERMPSVSVNQNVGAAVIESEAADANDLDYSPDAASASLATIWRVLQSIDAPAICVIVTFTITLALFPSLTVLIESVRMCDSESRWRNDLFTPTLFLIYNIFDFLGRVSAGILPDTFTKRTIYIPTFSRLVFFPLFALCNISGSRLPILLDSDVAPMLIMALFAFTGGFCASSCMMLGPSVASKKDGPLAGTIMVFCLTFGLLCGSCLSFVCLEIAHK